MPVTVYGAADCSLAAIGAQTVAMIGYGSQGRSHAQNLKDSGVAVIAGLRAGSATRQVAEADGIPVATVAEACAKAQVIMVMTPDEVMGAVYEADIAANLSPGDFLGFAHGFNIHYGIIAPPPGVHVFMLSPKGVGPAVRRLYTEGHGVAGLVATLPGPDGNPDSAALEMALSYGAAIGCSRAAIFSTSFREETETDLFGEQTVICGGIAELIKAAYDTLVAAGYSPELAYFECVHEVKLVTDLIHARGLSGMVEAISNTAEYGQYQSGPKVIGPEARAGMAKVLADIQSGAFAKAWLAENAAGQHSFKAARAATKKLAMEAVGANIRHRIAPK